MEKIIIPDGTEEISEKAFWGTGSYATSFQRKPVREIYIPSSVTYIGNDCFEYCGKELSPRKKCQAYFSNMPDFVTEGNCSTFGIDDAAVKHFRSSKK